MANIEKLPLFCRCVIQNFPFIEEDFDALTNYELICKVVEYLNKVITSQNEVINVANNLQVAFEELHNYVANYFANLDVQEEINNKLDDMAAEGTLQAIITAYLQIAGVLSFDSVSAMKASTNLIEGSVAKTTGFYSAGDLGGATYNVRAKTELDTPNEIDLFALYDDTLVAELVYESEMNVKQFGAKGDGSTDDTAVIQYAVSHCSNVYVPDGTYMVDGQYDSVTQSAILVPDNTSIKLAPNATLKVIPNSYTHYRILNIYQATNVKIEGGNLLGDKTTHLDTSGEWGFGIYVRESSDVEVKNMHIDDMWGDGIVITHGTNVITEGLIINNCRRNGYTISSGVNVHSINDTITNISGTAPQAGVDLEPDNENGYMDGIVFDNLTTKSCYTWGLSIQLRYMDNSKNIDIKINNHHDNDSGRALLIAKSATSVGNIEINQPYYENTRMSAITFMRAYDSNCKITIHKPYILNCNTSGQSNNKYSCGITCFFDTGQEVDNVGNISIVEPFITNARAAQVNGIFIDPSTGSLNNFSIINPLNSIDKNRINCVAGKHILFRDDYGNYINDIAISYTLPANNWYSLYTNTQSTANTTITLPSGIDIGRELTFLNSCKTKSLSIKLDNSEYCTQLSESAGVTIKLDNFGDRITLHKFDSTSWIIKDVNCTPTVS